MRINWTELIYTLFLLALLIGAGVWMWQTHLNSPCMQDPVPAEYQTACKSGVSIK